MIACMIKLKRCKSSKVDIKRDRLVNPNSSTFLFCVSSKQKKNVISTHTQTKNVISTHK